MIKRGESEGWAKSVVIHTDGASRGNPGPAALGLVVLGPDNQAIFEFAEPLGDQTNNFAEYTAVIRALELAAKGGAERVTIKSDSELLVRQLSGVYKVKSPVIKPLFFRCRELSEGFQNVSFEHVRREYNKEADALANEALDGALY